MNRRDLLVADLKAKSLMRQVLQKHEADFAPAMQEMMKNVSASPNTQPAPQPTQAPQVPPNQPQ